MHGDCTLAPVDYAYTHSLTRVCRLIMSFAFRVKHRKQASATSRLCSRIPSPSLSPSDSTPAASAASLAVLVRFLPPKVIVLPPTLS